MQYEYYSILEIERTATQDEIKRAYKKKAMELHPDRHGGDKTKEAEFKKVNEAYATLSDEQKKAHYDRFGSTEWMGGGWFGWFQWGFDVDLGDIFESFFSGGGMGGRGRKKAQIWDDIEIKLRISLEDAIRGTSRVVEYRKKSSCSSCSGTGAKNGTELKTCSTCGGGGSVRQQMRTVFGIMEQVVTCPDCHGNGKIITEKCDSCHGKWWQEEAVKKDITVPPGIENGMSIKLRGEGHMDRDGSGDLYVSFDVPEKEAGLIRDHMDLHYEVKISPAEAALWTEKTIQIPILGKKTLSIKHWTQHDTEITFRWEGIDSVERKWVKWNLIIHLSIDIPEKLSTEEKKLYEALLECQWGKKMEKWWLESIFGG